MKALIEKLVKDVKLLKKQVKKQQEDIDALAEIIHDTVSKRFEKAYSGRKK